jgi:diguanylate cyclase (GGDEF)-like protein
VHFIALLALQLPIRLTFDLSRAGVGLFVSVLTSGFALASVSRPQLRTPHHLFSAATVSAGMFAMLYASATSIRIAPPMSFDARLLTAFIVISMIASYGALWLAFKLRRGRSWNIVRRRIAASIVIGAAFTALHYVGLAAIEFPPDAHSLAGTVIDNKWFPIALGLFVVGIMGIALLTVVYDAFLARDVRDRDIARERANAHARYAARHDSLTDLPNRVAVVEAAEEAIEKAHRDKSEFALMVLNVDRLKTINDSLGHEAGDELLHEVAQRLRAVLRRTDSLARLAGDEFTILARHLNGPEDAERIIAKIFESLQAPFVTSKLELHASLSIGIAMFPGDGTGFDVLLRRAHVAMRAAKDSALGHYRFYSPEMSHLADDRLALETELRRALELEQLELHYQPKVDIASGRVRSAEALIRWRHPTRGLVTPGVFIPLAEETGLIVPIGEWVLRRACRQLRTWIDSGMRPVRVAVNLSAKQFRQADLAAVVKSALSESNLEPGYLELELTESAVMHDAEKSAATLQVLSTMGVHISIDDFGTGYSSLSYLRRFPLDKLKIDRSFIRDLMMNPDDVSIVRAIISLAHSLRLRVVAEGVETAEQLEFLRNLGCDQYQGFFCSPAVPAEAFADLIHRLRKERPEYTEADMLKTQSRLSAYTPT